MPRDDRTWETQEEQQAKELAEDTAKKAGKKVAKEGAKAAGKAAKKIGQLGVKAGKAIAAGAKALAQAFVATLPWSAIILGIVLAVILSVVLWFSYIDKIKQTVQDIKDGVVGVASKLLDLDQYDNGKRQAWNYGGDPDYTYTIYEKLKDNKEGDQTVDRSLTENLNDLMRSDTTYFAPEDLLDILEKCYQYNDEKYKIRESFYEYHYWSLDPHTASSGSTYAGDYSEWIDYYYWKWHVDKASTDNDGVYGTLINENVRGEKNDGEEIYTVHWQDICALMYFWGQGKYDNEDNGWGVSSENEYVYNEGTEYEINSSNGYYFTDEELETLFQIFSYKFDYLYNAVEDGSHRFESSAFKWPEIGGGEKGYDGVNGLCKGGYNVGYRYDRTAEPEDLDAHYSDPSAYGGDNPTPTYMRIDAAPNGVYNYMEQYKYAYVPTSEVPDYTPDPDKYSPPDGMYCVGKWQITDPRPFINLMRDMDDWFITKSYDTDYVEQFNYNWVDDMMDVYLAYLKLLDEALGTDRCSYYDHLRDLYNEEKIEVHYYGMKLPDDEMEAFIESIKADNPGMEVELIFDDDCKDYGDFYDVDETDPKDQAANGTIPFPSYGVTYVGGSYNDAVPDEWKHSGNIPGEYNYTGTIFISQHGNLIVNDWIYLLEGADEPLDGGHYYTLEQIKAMLSFMNSRTGVNTSKYDFTKCAADCYRFNQATGADIAGFLAIICTENSPKIAIPTYNWFNITAYGSEPGFKTSASSSYTWWDTKTEYSASYSSLGYSTLEGCCMVKCMEKIYRNYWTREDRKQNTYYRMTFNQYGWDLNGNVYFPQNWDEAIVQENIMDNVVGHCYCPWWDDVGYKTTHFNPANLWCNHCAQNRAKLISVAG